MAKATGRSKPGGRPSAGRFRPNPRRQAIYVALALASVAVGFGSGVLFRDDDAPNGVSVAIDAPRAPAGPAPWYSTQHPPPAMIELPDAPLFPEPMADAPPAPVRAYEEALPATVYEAEADPGRVEPPAAEVAPAPAHLPWRRYAVPVPVADGRPMIAVVIDDLGIDRARTARAIALGGPMTLSFLAYADGLAEQTARARAAGHELLVHIGMEPTSETVDPGPNVLRAGDDPAETARRLDWGLARFDAYVGINNHMGSRFTADAEGMRVVMEALKRRGLLFLDSRTTGRSVGARVARRLGVPVAERNVFLDNVNEVGAVNARLAELEAVARRRGRAVAIGHPREATLAALAAWLPTAAERGFRLVPISAIVAAEAGEG